MTVRPVYLGLYSEVVSYGTQSCLIPEELANTLDLKFESAISITVNNTTVLARAHLIDSSCIKNGYQVKVACQTICNISDINQFHFARSSKITTKDIKKLYKAAIKEVSVVIIFKSVEKLMKAKKHLSILEDHLKKLLSLYFMKENSVIDCSLNLYARMLGISHLIIKSVDLISNGISNHIQQDVGEMADCSLVNIVNLESQDWHNSKVTQNLVLGGLDTILSYLKTIILNHSKRKPGVLLVGPPGCGKSSIVRKLCVETKACLVVASEAQISGPIEQDNLKKLSNIVDRACSLSTEGPCVLFIDELDSLCPSQHRESTIYEKNLALLTMALVDKCQKYHNLFLIGATNRPYAVDLVMRRSGRLEKEILLNNPTEDERHKILEVHCENIFNFHPPRLIEIARATPGFVGADLKDLCVKVQHEMKNGNVCEDAIYDLLLKNCTSITPSFLKCLEFITTKPKVAEIGGLKDVKERLHSLFKRFSPEYAHFVKAFLLKRPRGILFYGPRGCGKTKLVSYIASKMNLAFISANASHLLSPYVGDSEKKVAALLQAARLAQPSVLFLDEIDGIFGSRDHMSGPGVQLNILTELLQGMDGAHVNASSLQGSCKLGDQIKKYEDHLFVCAATNHPDKLDSALLRPGRFDHFFYIPPPDVEARLDILKIKTSKLDVEDGCLGVIAEKTEGWTGADLEALITRTFSKAVLEHDLHASFKIVLTKELLLSAVEKTKPSLSNEEIKKYEDFKRKVEKK